MVRINQIPHYILPGPVLVLESLIHDWGTLFPSLLVTLADHLHGARPWPSLGGVGLAILFTTSKWIELQLLPVRRDPAGDADHRDRAADPDLRRQRPPGAPDLRLDRRLLPDPLEHDARPEQRRPQSASTCSSSTAPRAGRRCCICACRRRMPYFLGGLKIAGGLSLIGAIVAEFAAGTAGTGSGLAYRILEAGYRLNIPRMFAAVFLISLDRHPDLPGLQPALAPGPAPLARERGPPRELMCASSPLGHRERGLNPSSQLRTARGLHAVANDPARDASRSVGRSVAAPRCA